MSACLDVVAAVVWHDGRFLAVERPPGKSHAGKWEFPGGKVEPGESEQEALARELREELGIDPGPMTFWKSLSHAYPHVTVRLSFFHIHAFKGVARPLEGQGLCWLTPVQAAGYPFLEADLGLVAELAALTRPTPNP